MKNRQIPILPIILMLAIVAAGYGLYKNVEFEQIDIDIGLSDDARKNQLLAAGRLLEKEGFTFEIAEDRRIFSDLNIESTGVLWLANIDVLEDQREATEILAWIESGGILLTSSIGEYPFDEATVPGWFMQQAGIEPLDEDIHSDAELLDNWMEGPYTLALPDTSLAVPKILLYTYSYPFFKSAAREPENTRTIIDSPYLIHRSLGAGYFSMYADYDQFYNNKIDKYDQGYLLLWLTEPARNKSIAMVFRPASKPGLFTLLWSKYTLAICLAGLVLIGFLRLAASRLGPIEQELPPIKNNIMAHLEARGNYWHRHRQTDKVLEVVQEATLDSLGTRGGKLLQSNDHTIDKSAVIKQACAILRCTPEHAEKILFHKATKNVSLLRTVRALQKLNHRKQLKSKK